MNFGRVGLPETQVFFLFGLFLPIYFCSENVVCSLHLLLIFKCTPDFIYHGRRAVAKVVEC